MSRDMKIPPVRIVERRGGCGGAIVLAATTTAATLGAVLGAVTGWAAHARLGAPLPVHRRPEALPPNVRALRQAAHHHGAIVWPANPHATPDPAHPKD